MSSMSSDLGALGTYALTQQKMQVAMVKAANDTDQAVIDMMNEGIDNGRSISASNTHGKNVDVSL